MNNITIADSIITKKNNFLVNALVLFTFWYLFTGFPIAFNGIFKTMLGGKLGLIVVLLQLFFFFYYSSTSNCFSQKNQKYAIVFTLGFVFIWILKIICIGEIDNNIITSLLGILMLLLLKDDLKIEYLKRFIKILSVILILSIIEYLIYVLFHVGITLYTNLERYGMDDTLIIQLYEQHLFNIFAIGTDFPRLQSLCEEPGCVGTICGFLIYATRGWKELRIQYFVFVIAGFLSFSLAFYILFAMHLLISEKKGNASTIIILASLIVLAYIYLYEFFEYRVLFRLQEGDADNRITGDFNFVFNQTLSNGELWLPHESKGSFGAGAKMWLFKNGIIAFIIMFFSYTYYFFGKVKEYSSPKLACFLFFMAFWLSFYQRHWITNLDYMIVYVAIPIIYATKTISPTYKYKK